MNHSRGNKPYVEETSEHGKRAIYCDKDECVSTPYVQKDIVSIPDFEQILARTNNGHMAIDSLCVISVASSMLAFILERLFVVNQMITDILHIFHIINVLILVIRFRFDANTLHASLAASINKSIEQEHLKIRHVLHDLKQPAALMLCVAAEEPMDRKLLSALCQQLSSRIKAVTDTTTDAKPYVIVKVNEMIARLAWRYGRLFTARGVNFKYHSTVSDSLLIFALVDGVERAVENLLSNANKFTSDGGSVSLSVRTVSEADIVMVMIEVTDDGKGMTVEESEFIWNDNYKGQSDSIGSGLGLPSIKAFAMSEGGTVWAGPNRSSGSTVGFGFACMTVEEGACEESNRGIRRSASESELQMASLLEQTRQSLSLSMCVNPEELSEPEHIECSEGVDGLHAPDEQYSNPNEHIDRRPHTVLLVEDDPLQMRINIKKLNKHAPFGSMSIFTATEGGAGLRRLRDINYDALITDMNMPVMDGATMIRIAGDENVLPPITKLLSAQTIPIKHFESFGISAHMVYDKTDTEVDVFKDVVSELQAKTLEMCEISVTTNNIGYNK